MGSFTRYVLPLAASMLIAQAAVADDISYTYAQGGYQSYLDDGDGGFFAGGSFQITDDIYIAGEFSKAEFDGNFELEVISVRGGYIFPLDNGMHAYAEGGMAKTEATISVTGEECTFVGFQVQCETVTRTASADDTSLMFAGGVRTMVTPELELRGGAEMYLGDFDEINLIGEGVYSFGGALSALGQLAYGNEAEDLRMRIGVRFDF